MAQNLERLMPSLDRIGSIFGTSGSRTSFALDSAFVNGTSGDAVAIRYMAQAASKITEVYVFCADKTGSPSTFTCTIYNESSNAARAGTTSRSSSTTVTLPAGSTGWMKFDTFSDYTPTVGEILWIVIHNTTDTPASNYISVLTATNTVFFSGATSFHATGYTTTAGFSSNGTQVNEMPFVINHGGTYVGQPFTQRTTRSSASTEYGFQFTPTEDVKVSGVLIGVGSANYADFRILADATAPGGSALNSYDLDSDSNETTCDLVGAKMFDSVVTLSGGTTYKCTLTFGASVASPSHIEIEDYSTYSSMFDTLRGYDLTTLPWVVTDDGGGGWTTSKDKCLELMLIVQDNPEIASGGGLIRHPGMNGGLNG